MSKVVEFKAPNDNALSFIDKTKEILKNENIDNLLVLAKSNNGEIMIGNTANININELLEFNAHIQLYATDKMIKANYVE